MANEKRVERLQKQILRILSQKVLFELNDPRISSLVTLTKVILKSDLSSAKVYFSVLGGESEKNRAEHALRHAKRHLRGELGKELVIRTLPDIEFLYDESIEGAVRIVSRLGELTQDLHGEEDEGDDESNESDNDEDADTEEELDKNLNEDKTEISESE
ncbi:MAG: 30S ribosome-binding factor RbfA [Planctomycetes bacterium]|nr:30S ribosome-binding factor RbfA [Planctomycetota bacterium]